MNLKSIDKAYTSPYDKFLAEFDKTHSLSQSQIKEIKKAKEIADLETRNELRTCQSTF